MHPAELGLLDRDRFAAAYDRFLELAVVLCMLAPFVGAVRGADDVVVDASLAPVVGAAFSLEPRLQRLRVGGSTELRVDLDQLGACTRATDVALEVERALYWRAASSSEFCSGEEAAQSSDLGLQRGRYSNPASEASALSSIRWLRRAVGAGPTPTPT
jgi:hypothetical protein